MTMSKLIKFLQFFFLMLCTITMHINDDGLHTQKTITQNNFSYNLINDVD